LFKLDDWKTVMVWMAQGKAGAIHVHVTLRRVRSKLWEEPARNPPDGLMTGDCFK